MLTKKFEKLKLKKSKNLYKFVFQNAQFLNNNNLNDEINQKNY